MKFSEQYLTYDEYVGLGGHIQEMPFNLLENKARKVLDKYTLGRLKEEQNIGEDVKNCMYELIDTMLISGEYLDGTRKDKENILKNIILNNLSEYILNGERIIYRGV